MLFIISIIPQHCCILESESVYINALDLILYRFSVFTGACMVGNLHKKEFLKRAELLKSNSFLFNINSGSFPGSALKSSVCSVPSQQRLNDGDLRVLELLGNITCFCFIHFKRGTKHMKVTCL